MTRNLQPFGWYGGKNRMFNFLLEHMPSEHHHFVDVFGGSGVVLLNRPPAGIDTYNDIHGGLVNFFRVLRNESEELIRLLKLTPYSREELATACNDEGGLSHVERARRFYCMAMFAWGGRGQTASAGMFRFSIHTQRSGIAAPVSGWLNHIEGLYDIVTRLREVQIESLPAIDILQKYDSASTFFYLDPPYVHSTRVGTDVYEGEMDDAAHEEMATLLHGIKGQAMVSGYRCELYDRIFADWRCVDDTPYVSSCSGQDRIESIWMNYSAQAAGGLF